MAATRLPRDLTARLLEEGWGPTQISGYLREHLGIEVTANSISQFRKRHTDIPPSHDSERKMPWSVKREHYNSVYRHAILAWKQREADHPLSDERARNLMSIETRLQEARPRQVIDYNPRRKGGFFLREARPGVDLGIVYEPDGKPRPATKGPYALGLFVLDEQTAN
jgi:hypothetical protein